MKALLALALLSIAGCAEATVKWKTVYVLTDGATYVYGRCSSDRYSLVPFEEHPSYAVIACTDFAEEPPQALQLGLGVKFGSFHITSPVSNAYSSYGCMLVADVHVNAEEQFVVECDRIIWPAPGSKVFANGFEQK